MNEKKFRTAFLAHVPDANPERDRCIVETGLYKLTSVLVKDDEEAIRVCKELVKEDGVHSLLLCPGFTHKAISRIIDAVGEKVAVSVARGDGPSTQIALKVMKEAGWFQE